MTNEPRLGRLTIARTTYSETLQDDLIQVLDENGAFLARMYHNGKWAISSGLDITPTFGSIEFAILNGTISTTFQIWMASPVSKYMFQFTKDFLELRGLKVMEGTNQRQGVATLVAGTVTVNNTAITANSRIFLTAQNSSGTAGELSVSARTAGTSFTITSTSSTDTRQVAYLINEPGSFLT